MDYLEYYDNRPGGYYANPPPVNAAYQYDFSLPKRNDLDLKTDDELFVETWLSRIGKININLDSIEIKVDERRSSNKSNLKITEIKESIIKWMNNLKRLETLRDNLSIEGISDEEWNKKMEEIECLKSEINGINLPVELAKRSVRKRRKKRNRQRNKRAEAKLIKNEKRIEDERIHKEVDDWLGEMKESVERAKAEENMKKDADCVLAEVTKKKTDAKKQLNLITALVKLRDLRENVALQRGDKLCKEDHSAFYKTTDRLTTMWENSSRTYSKEEQGLKIMLEQNASEETKQNISSKERKNSNEWTSLLFGETSDTSNPINWNLTVAERDLDAFITIRKKWDAYLHPDGTKIPIGWVTPNENPNNAWVKFELILIETIDNFQSSDVAWIRDAWKYDQKKTDDESDSSPESESRTTLLIPAVVSAEESLFENGIKFTIETYSKPIALDILINSGVTNLEVKQSCKIRIRPECSELQMPRELLPVLELLKRKI